MKRLVLAFDGSEGSMGAVTALSHLDLAAWTVELVTVVPTGEWPSRQVAKRRTHVQRTLERRGAQVSPRLLEGEPAAAVLEVADQVNADLIVLGPRRIPSLLERVFGTVSRAVIRRARCCVMVGRLTLAKESALLVIGDEGDVRAFGSWWPRLPIPSQMALAMQIVVPEPASVDVEVPAQILHTDARSIERYRAAARASSRSAIEQSMRRVVGPATTLTADPSDYSDRVAAIISAERLAAAELILLRNSRGGDLELLAAQSGASLILLP
ncbi:MAG: universal stress protein [Candidatus Sericytochromatia bacterium]|nr:universal stress protein [Candidatus Tanganyikabacteria bacterium]